MYEHVTEQEVAAAIDELARGLGVKETLRLTIPSALSPEDLPRWVQTVADSLGLPVRVDVSLISTDSAEPGFGTTNMSRTDSRGRGIEGITAQVRIPTSIPMFGTEGLRNFPIEVRVSQNCGKSPATFVAIMAHELSHVLLASLRHPRRDSELHTDLVPLLLGFRRIASVGRTRVERGTEGEVRTTFGYLTDPQFYFAVGYVEDLLCDARKKREDVARLLQWVTTAVPNASRQLARFKAYRAYVNHHPPKKTKGGDGARLVRFNGVNYTGAWKGNIEKARSHLAASGGAFPAVSHYTSKLLQRLDREHQQLSSIADRLDDTLKCVTADAAILRRYLPLAIKLRENRWIAWLFGGRIGLEGLMTESDRSPEVLAVPKRASSDVR